MIEQIRNVPITPDSYPLTRASENCNFAYRGYCEEEYFMYGVSNVYAGRHGKIEALYSGAPYVNRFLVRRPKDIAAASGRVAIEILNATSGFDVDRTWVLCKEQMMREGDVYIGITSKPSSLRPLHKFDPQRYAELFWSNPNPAPLARDIIERSKFGGAYEQASEMGLFWDMLTDLASAVRSGAEFMGKIQPKKIYLVGWSQSCGYMIRYANCFGETGTASVFDGYFSAAGVRMMTPPLNQYESSIVPGETGNVFGPGKTPCILVQTESENAGMGNLETKLPDSDGPQRWIRTYEIPGATHDSEYTMLGYYGDKKDEFKTGLLLDYPGEEPWPNNYPYELAFCAAYAHLCDWVEKDVKPPHMQPIELDFAGRNVRDSLGNAVGGWRLPPIDYPVCTYFPYCTPIVPSPFLKKPLFGCRFPFSTAQLHTMYGSLAQYQKLVEQSADECIAAGRLLEADRGRCINYCLKEAQMFGLTE